MNIREWFATALALSLPVLLPLLLVKLAEWRSNTTTQ